MTRAAAGLGLALLACACAREPPLDEVQAAARRELWQGNLEAAERLALVGLSRAAETSEAEWAHRFQVLRAEVLVERRAIPEALALLEGDAAPGEAAGEVEVRALLARGYARCLSGGGDESRRRALADLDEARRRAGRLESAELLGEERLRTGVCALVQGETAEAEARFRESLDAAGPDDPLLSSKAMVALGLLRMWTERYDDAADWFERARETSPEKAHLQRVRVLGNLGWCLFELGEYRRALAFLSEAEALAATHGHAGDRLTALQNMGNAHHRLGDFAVARTHYDRALLFARDLGNDQAVAQLLSNLGIAALNQARYDEAERYSREALRLKESIGDLVGRQQSLLALGQIELERGDHDHAEELFRQVAASPHTSREAMWETQASTALLLTRTGRAGEADAAFGRAAALMEELRSELRHAESRISFSSSLDGFHDDYVGFLVESGRTEQALEVGDMARARGLREGLGREGAGRPAGLGRIRAAVRALDAVVLFYWLAPDRSFLWSVTGGDVSLHVLPGEREIARRTESLQRAILQSRDPLTETSEEATWLYRHLIAPAEDRLSSVSRVVVVPDGALHQVNPATFVVPGPRPHYWIEDVVLSAAPSLALLAEEGSGGSRPATGALIIGDPLPADEEFPRLAGAAGEIERVAAQFPASQRTIHSGADAAPEVYGSSHPGRYAVIHFAAHAKANPQVPLDSAVILSPGEHAYKLYARDLVEIPIRARLVTLSACRSAGSRAYAGEGLVGLAWAFLSAGAANVIAGLWNVEDASTSELMGRLYRELGEGGTPAAALRAAQLEMLRSDTAYAKPYYWAPFVAYTQQPGTFQRPPASQPTARTPR